MAGTTVQRNLHGLRHRQGRRRPVSRFMPHRPTRFLGPDLGLVAGERRRLSLRGTPGLEQHPIQLPDAGFQLRDAPFEFRNPRIPLGQLRLQLDDSSLQHSAGRTRLKMFRRLRHRTLLSATGPSENHGEGR